MSSNSHKATKDREAPAGLRLAWQVLRAEGAAAVRDRALDRLTAWRRRRGFRLVDELSVPATPPPVLNVLPTPPRPDFGGVQVQLLRRLEAEGASRPWALLYPEADAYRLEVVEVSRRRAVVYRAPVRLAPDRLRDDSFATIVSAAARSLGTTAVHFEQLAGLPLESVAELRASGLTLVVSVHDFGLFCVRPHLVERPRLRFCGYCREAARCARCLAQDWDLEEGFQERRREVAAGLLRLAEAVIYPSDFLRRTYAELVPGLEPGRQWVVEPPSVTEPVRTPAIEPRRVRHLAYVGSVQPHKGALVLEALLRAFSQDRHPDVRWTVFGGGDRDILRRLRRLPAVRVRGYYRAGELPRLLRDHRVDLALLLSIWPESYALTLDECWLAGVPVLAFDHGALAERVRVSGGGTLANLDGFPQTMFENLQTILDRGFAGSARVGFKPPDAVSAAGTCLRIYRALHLHRD